MRHYILIKNLFKKIAASISCSQITFIRVTQIHLTLSLWIKVNKSQFQSEETIFEWGKSRVTKNLITRIIKISRSTKSEKWRYAHTSVEIARANDQKADLNWLWRHMVVAKKLTTQ